MSHRGYVAYHVAMILATPFLILAIDPNLFINANTNSWIDPWLYTGFFLSLPEFLERWGSTYYATRLAWLLPGFAVHQLFSPVVANYVLHIAFFYVLLFSTYALVTSAVSRTTGFVAAMLMGWAPELIAALGWDYVDGAVITYFTVSLLCLERSSSSRHWRLWAIAAGAGFACLAASNLVGTTLWPIGGLFLLLRMGAARWRTTLAIVALGAIGAAVTLAGLGFANQQLGGQFLFLKPSVVYASGNMWVPSPWDVKGLAWLRDAPALILPAVAAFGALLALAGRIGILRSFSGAIQLTLLAAAVWFVVHSVLWTHSIHISYYSSYMIPLALLALAVHPDSPLSMPAPVNLRRAVAVELAVLGLLVAHFFVFRHGDIMWISIAPAVATQFGINTYVAFGVAAGALLTLRFVRVSWLRWPAFLLALLMAYSSVPTNWATPAMARVKEDFSLTAEVHDFILQHLDRSRAVRMWYTIRSGEPRPYRNISSTFLWGYALLNEAMPSLEQTMNPVDSAPHLVLMVANDAEVEAARQSLRKAGFSYSPQVQQEFGPGSARFRVIIGDLTVEPTP